jgi:hypothetical protein
MDAFNSAVLSDHDLLYGGVLDLVAENKASARRWARVVELHRRHPDTDGNFSMTASEWTALEASEVWALNGNHARSQLKSPCSSPSICRTSGSCACLERWTGSGR